MVRTRRRRASVSDYAGPRGAHSQHTRGLHRPPFSSQIVQRTTSNDAYASNTAYAVNRSYTVNGLNQYTAAGPATFLYDGNGNLRSDGSSTFVYDGENRLVSASGARNAALAYDPLGRLFQVSGGSAGVQQFLYDGDALIAEYNTAGTVMRRHAHGADPGADDPLISWESGYRLSLFTDHQGSVIAYAWTNGAALLISAYDSWGIPNATNQGRFGYTGQAWLPELGMWYYKARVYSPTLGRFLQTDPVGYEDQVNLYAYVANDPVNSVDPDGRRCISLNYRTEFCGRSRLYALNDRMVGNRTNFFAAASAVTSLLANMHLLGSGVSGRTREFMSIVSAGLERFNSRIVAQIMSGHLGGANLDLRIIRAEQGRVEQFLNALNSDTRQHVVAEINGLLNPDLSTRVAADVLDARSLGVLDRVRQSLGGKIDFGNQGHRVALGVGFAREFGNCSQTGTRIRSC